ncbi:MAG TPA: carboxylesterase/lipase family protein [Rhizomicrobium sp.]
MNNRSDVIDKATVETPSGRLAGSRRRGVFKFRGIPFAKPPVAGLRWRMPEPAEPWVGVRDATQAGAVCPQAPTPFDALLGGALSAQSEDCLYLNVFAPALEGQMLPVMVWIHGGAFVIGAGSQPIYDGVSLAARGAVVVTINYRLGVFGLLDLRDGAGEDMPGTGVEGVADQLLALDWVRRNIAAFGGDPGNVTIFGESAGAMCVAALLAAPARGLFHRAILQSGAAHVGSDREKSCRVAHAVLNALSLSRQDWRLLLDIPAGALLKAQVSVLASAHDGKDLERLGRLPFQPVIDGRLLAEKPIAALRGGAARDIPLLVGTTREEWKLFSAPDPRSRLMTSAGFEARVARTAGEATPDLLRAYGSGRIFERYNAFMTDRTFAVPAHKLLETRAAGAPAFAYRFDWRSRLLGGIFGSCHALELGFVFGTHGEGAASAFFGKGALAEKLAHDMMSSWTAFARTGDPSSPASGLWPRYDSDARATMIFGDGAPHVVNAPERDRMDAWETVPDQKIGA